MNSILSRKVTAAPGRWPILGHLIPFGSDPLAFLDRCGATGADLLELVVPGRPAYLVNSAPLMREILERQHERFDKSSSPRDTGGVFGNGVFTARGATWVRQRRLLVPVFSKERVAALASDADAFMRRQCAQWRAERIDAYEEMTAYVLGTTLTGLLGPTAGQQPMLAPALAVLTQRFRDELPAPRTLSAVLPGWAALPGNRRLHRAVQQLRELAAALLRAPAAARRLDDTLLQRLSSAAQSGSGADWTEAIDQVVTLMLTSYETTRAAATWLLWQVACNPAVQKQLRAEFASVAACGPFDAESIPRLSYAHAVVDESLRLMPTAWGTNRRCLHDGPLGDYHVPRGHYVFLSQWLTHRDSRYFESPLRFDPGRWLRPTGADPTAFFPFGAGPRRCPGERLAHALMQAMLTAVVSEFELRADPAATPALCPSITLAPAGPVWIEVRRRAAHDSA